MNGFSREFILESIEDYERNIRFYKEMIESNEVQIKNPKISQKKKQALETLNSVAKKEIEKCQKEIRKFL